MRKFQKPTTENEINMWQAACEAILITGLIAVVLGLVVGFFIGLGQGIDKQIDNQNTMLCESAKRSGNEEYLKKCRPYYESGNIESVRESL